MKKFDFSKEFGNIDSKYIYEAEKEWQRKTSSWTPTFWSRVVAACVIITLGSVIFSNPRVQAAIKDFVLSIGDTLGFSKGIESYTEVLKTSQTDNGITATLEEIVLDEGMLLAEVHAEPADFENKTSFDSMAGISINEEKTTINGQKLEVYASGDYLPYSEEDILSTDMDEYYEKEYDNVMETRFHTPKDLGENPQIHLVLNAFKDDWGMTSVAEFQFDFTISRTEILKQTIHKKLENISISTTEGEVKLKELSINKLQSTISAEIPETLSENYFAELRGTDSKGNKVRYELTDEAEYNSHHWSFRTNFWNSFDLEDSTSSVYPKMQLPDIDSEYLELQLYIKLNTLPAEIQDIDFDDYELSDTDEATEDAEVVLEEEIIDNDVTSEEETPIESAIIGGADAPTTIILQKNQNDNAYTEDSDDYATEDSGTYDEESEDEWTAVGDKIKIWIK